MPARRRVAESALESSPAPASQTLKDIPSSERPRERLLERGPGALSDSELLAILLRTGRQGEMVTELTRDLITEYGGLQGLMKATPAQLALRAGIGPAKAAQLKAALELGKRAVAESPESRPQIRQPADIFRLVEQDMCALEQEVLKVLLLDTKNRVLRIVPMYTGSLNQSLVRVGELFKHAIRENCAGIAVVHNHPSGDPTPSPEDVKVTEEIIRAGKILDVDVIDHVVVGRNAFVSLKERGLAFR